MTVGPLRAVVLWTSVSAASLGVAAAHSLSRPRVRSAPAVVEEAQAAPAAAPQLNSTKTTLQADPDSGPTSAVTVTGQGFAPGLRMTLSNPQYVFTFGPDSLEPVSNTSFQFDAKPIPEGVYALVVRNGSGRPSNAITLVVRRR